MPHPSRMELSARFCSYCGYPPASGWPQRPDRGCGRCEIGAIVRAPARLAPHPGDPFLIVDDRLVVRTVSRNAEALLPADREIATGARLDSLLVPALGEAGVQLTELIELAAPVHPAAAVGGVLIAGFATRPPGRARTLCGAEPRAAVIAGCDG